MSNLKFQNSTLYDKKFSYQDISHVPRRIFQYWKRKNYLLRTNPGGWSKFNYFELFWIGMLAQARMMRISLDEYVFDIKRIFVTEPDMFEIEYEEMIDTYSSFIFQALSNLTNQCGIILPFKGSPSLVSEFEMQDTSIKYFKLKEGQRIFSKHSYIYLSYTDVLISFLNTFEIEDIQALGLLNGNEIKLLKSLRKDEIESFYVQQTSQSFKSDGSNIEDLISKLMLAIFSKNYVKIEYQTEFGESITFLKN